MYYMMPLLQCSFLSVIETFVTLHYITISKSVFNFKKRLRESMKLLANNFRTSCVWNHYI